jgi:4-aminobutyrate aminotransferase/(S)-3-amino-2-methylpropionate transaminase
LTSAVVAQAEKRGLILLSCGVSANVVRLLSPLTIQETVLEEGLNILADSLKAAYGVEAKTRAA